MSHIARQTVEQVSRYFCIYIVPNQLYVFQSRGRDDGPDNFSALVRCQATEIQLDFSKASNRISQQISLNASQVDISQANIDQSGRRNDGLDNFSGLLCCQAIVQGFMQAVFNTDNP